VAALSRCPANPASTSRSRPASANTSARSNSRRSAGHLLRDGRQPTARNLAATFPQQWRSLMKPWGYGRFRLAEAPAEGFSLRAPKSSAKNVPLRTEKRKTWPLAGASFDYVHVVKTVSHGPLARAVTPRTFRFGAVGAAGFFGQLCSEKRDLCGRGGRCSRLPARVRG
jgi:hypothetical protein